jgi:Protein of unknown function (DUF669)
MSEQNYFAQVDWSQIEPQSGGREIFEVNGWHKVIMSDSKGAPNSKNTGMLFTAYLKCMEGPDNGRTIDHNMNVFHQNAQAQEIGQREFSGYCHALGEFKPVDNHFSNGRNKPLMARTETVDEEFQNSKGETVKARRTYVRELARVGDPKTTTGATSGNASNGAATPTTPPPAQTANQTTETTTAQSPSNEATVVQAGWGAPPPTATGNAAPANKAPWNS